MKSVVMKPLPYWWMIATEIGLFAAAAWFISESQYIEAIALVILIEIRDFSWNIKRSSNKE